MKMPRRPRAGGCRHGARLGSSDVNRKPNIWYTKKIPIPNRYLVFLSQISWYFLGVYRYFEEALVKIWLNIGVGLVSV